MRRLLLSLSLLELACVPALEVPECLSSNDCAGGSICAGGSCRSPAPSGGDAQPADVERLDAAPRDARVRDAAPPPDAGDAGVPDAAVEDPWARTLWELGDGASIEPAALAIGARGEVIAAAHHELPLRTGTATITPQDIDAVVVAWTSEGRLSWTLPIGGDGDQRVHAVATTTTGAVMIAGEFRGDLVVDGAPAASASTLDAFLVWFDPGTRIQRTLTLGGFGAVRAEALVIAGSTVYLGGTFNGNFTDGGECTFDTGIIGSQNDAFVAAIDLRTLRCTWAHGFGGAGRETFEAIAWDSRRERIVATGLYAGDLLLRGSSGRRDQRLEHRGDRSLESYVLGFDTSGAIEVLDYIGGPRDERVLDLLVDPDGQVQLAGSFPDSPAIESRGGALAVAGHVVGLTLDGNLRPRSSFFTARLSGDPDSLDGKAITWIDGQVVIAADLDDDSSYRIGRDSVTSTSDDVVVIGFEPVSGAPIWSEHFTSAGDELATAAAYDPRAERLVIGGRFDAALALPGAVVVEPQAGRDAFVFRYRP